MNISQGQQFQNNDPFASLRGLSVSAKQSSSKAKQAPPSQMTLRARKLRRSADLVRAITGIDAQSSQVEMVRWLQWISENYEVSDCGLLLGLFSHCYLGDPYIDHRLDLSLSVIEHYTAADSVPDGFEVARPLARNENYAYIEVYTDGSVIPVYFDGRPGVGILLPN